MEELGKRQADFVKDLGWNPARISLMVRGLQPYTRDDIGEVAAYLRLEPYELLMQPYRALAIRRIAEAARLLDASQAPN